MPQGFFAGKEKDKQKNAISTDCTILGVLGTWRGENVVSRILTVLREREQFEEALSFLRTLFSPFGKDTLGSVAGFLQEVLEEEAFVAEDTKAELIFVRNGYNFEGFVSSLGDGNEEICFI